MCGRQVTVVTHIPYSHSPLTKLKGRVCIHTIHIGMQANYLSCHTYFSHLIKCLIYFILFFAKPAFCPLWYLLLVISRNMKQLCMPLIQPGSRHKEMNDHGAQFCEAYSLGGRRPWVEMSTWTRVCVRGPVDTSHRDGQTHSGLTLNIKSLLISDCSNWLCPCWTTCQIQYVEYHWFHQGTIEKDICEGTLKWSVKRSVSLATSVPVSSFLITFCEGP